MVHMAKAMHAESPRFRHLDFSMVKTANCIIGLLVSDDGGVVVVEDEGHIVAMLGGFVTEHFFGTDKVACDLGVYVSPEHRGSLYAFRMVRAFEKWAKERGAVDMVLGISTENDADMIRKLYGRMGYADSGYVVRRTL